MEAAEAWKRLLAVRTLADALAAGLRETDGRWRWSAGAADDSSGDGSVPLVSDQAAQLADLYAPLCLAGSPYVVAQLGQSIDGFIATHTGDANFVTGDDDRRHLHRVRALVDAVVIGAGTAVADDPRLTVRAVPGPNPVRVVVDPRARVPLSHGLLTDGAADTLWLISEQTSVPTGLPAHVDVMTLPVGVSGRFEPRQVLAALGDRGLERVLVEGGGVTVSSFLQADLLDRLYLTVAPVLIGDGVPGLRFPGEAVMRDALRPASRTFPLGVDVLFELDLRGREGSGPLA